MNAVTEMPAPLVFSDSAANKVKQLIDAGTLGEIYFVTSSRMNLGKYQSDGVVCDLAPHDLSILLYLLAPLPILIVGLGWSHRAALAAVVSGGLALALFI